MSRYETIKTPLKERTADDIFKGDEALPHKFTSRTLQGIIDQLKEYGFHMIDTHNDWLYLEKDGEEWEAEVTHYFRGDYELMSYNIAYIGESNLHEAYEGGYETFRNHIGELDTAYNPYKKVADAPDLNKDFDMWTSGTPKATNDVDDIMSMSGEELSNAYRHSDIELDYLENNLYDVQKEARLDYDWESVNRYKQKISNERKRFAAIKNRLKQLYTDGQTDGISSDIIERFDREAEREAKLAKNKAAAEKRKATMAANAPARKAKALAELPQQALETVTTPELKELLDENGMLKERRSWGVIKNYFDNPEGKLLKKLWIAQYSNR